MYAWNACCTTSNKDMYKYKYRKRYVQISTTMYVWNLLSPHFVPRVDGTQFSPISLIAISTNALIFTFFLSFFSQNYIFTFYIIGGGWSADLSFVDTKISFSRDFIWLQIPADKWFVADFAAAPSWGIGFISKLILLEIQLMPDVIWFCRKLSAKKFTNVAPETAELGMIEILLLVAVIYIDLKWSRANVKKWRCDIMTLWHCDIVTLWHCDIVTLISINLEWSG